MSCSCNRKRKNLFQNCVRSWVSWIFVSRSLLFLLTESPWSLCRARSNSSAVLKIVGSFSFLSQRGLCCVPVLCRGSGYSCHTAHDFSLQVRGLQHSTGTCFLLRQQSISVSFVICTFHLFNSFFRIMRQNVTNEGTTGGIRTLWRFFPLLFLCIPILFACMMHQMQTSASSGLLYYGKRKKKKR